MYFLHKKTFWELCANVLNYVIFQPSENSEEAKLGHQINWRLLLSESAQDSAKESQQKQRFKNILATSFRLVQSGRLPFLDQENRHSVCECSCHFNNYIHTHVSTCMHHQKYNRAKHNTVVESSTNTLTLGKKNKYVIELGYNLTGLRMQDLCKNLQLKIRVPRVYKKHQLNLNTQV